MRHLFLSSLLVTGLALSGVSAVYAADQYGNPQDSMQESESSRQNPAANPSGEGQEYTVKAGDTLASIAEAELGSSDKWQKIAQANNIQNPDRIFAGQKLTIPASQDGTGSTAKNEETPQQTEHSAQQSEASSSVRAQSSDTMNESDKAAQEQNIKGEITQIGTEKDSLMLKEDNGQTHSLKLQDDQVLQGVTVGDFVIAKVENGTVISLEKVDKGA